MSARIVTMDKASGGEEPIEDYKKQVEKGTVSTLPYERLMIYYRKQKLYEEELKVIKKGIAALKDFYADLQKTSLKRIDPKIKALSKKIGRSTGLIDTKGNHVFLPEPLPKWMKREETVEGKIKNASVRKKKKKKR